MSKRAEADRRFQAARQRLLGSDAHRSLLVALADDPETLVWEDEDIRPCAHCGRRFSEAEIELTQGWCPCCGGKWEGGS